MKPQNKMYICTLGTAKSGNKCTTEVIEKHYENMHTIYAFTFCMYVQAHDS